MINAIQEFIQYLHSVKKMSHNTEISYERDLKKDGCLAEGTGIDSVNQVTGTSLNSYMLYLERENLAAATVSRRCGRSKGFFQYQVKRKPYCGRSIQQFKTAES